MACRPVRHWTPPVAPAATLSTWRRSATP
jgi:hypothetical protein